MKISYFIFVFQLLLTLNKTLAQSQLLYTIDFDHNSYKLSESRQRLLDTLSAKLKVTDFSMIKIVGIADTTGSQLHNDVLSRKRAEAVERYLKKWILIPDEKLYVTWLGESTDGVYDLHFPDIHAQQRCVDIIVHFKKEDR